MPASAAHTPPPGRGQYEPIGSSPAFLEFQEQLRQVAPVDRPVLLIGERGTGKEMAAQRLHYLSGRWGEPLVTLNCSALAPTLIESELFGHEEGAFTGARRRRLGRFEAADEGTLFLDEISLIPLEAQEKILRVVEYGAFERVGGTEAVRVDVRLIGATNVDLRREADAGRFKRDLLDRLSFEVLFLPPLRARGEDIPLLANHFAARMAHELGRHGIPQFAEEAMKRLMRHSWPGNIRELKNVVERAVYRVDEDAEIDEFDFDPFCSPFAPPLEEPGTASTGGDPIDRLIDEALEGADAWEPLLDAAEEDEETRAAEADDGENENGAGAEAAPLPLQDTVRRVEIAFLQRALEETRYNQRRAAKLLGLTYHQFRGLYRKHGEMLRRE